MEFLGMGTLEILVVLLIALAIFGPNRLVEIARKLGRFVREISKVGSEFTKTLSEENMPKEERKTVQELKKIGSEVSQTLNEASQATTEATQGVNQSPAGSIPVSENTEQKTGPTRPSFTQTPDGKQTLASVPQEPTESKPS